MVAPILEQPIDELTRRYAESGKDARLKRREKRQTTGKELRKFYRETYDWLAYQSTPSAVAPLVVGLRLAPRVVMPVYLGAKGAKLFVQASEDGYFGTGPGVGLERTPEIARYEDSAIRTSRII